MQEFPLSYTPLSRKEDANIYIINSELFYDKREKEIFGNQYENRRNLLSSFPCSHSHPRRSRK
jgi:hypothetical protein